MCTMPKAFPKAFPKEFREDVIRVYKDSDASMAQVAKDFGISPSCLKRWLSIDDRSSASPSPAGRAANESDALGAPRPEHRVQVSQHVLPRQKDIRTVPGDGPHRM